MQGAHVPVKAFYEWMRFQQDQHLLGHPDEWSNERCQYAFSQCCASHPAGSKNIQGAKSDCHEVEGSRYGSHNLMKGIVVNPTKPEIAGIADYGKQQYRNHRHQETVHEGIFLHANLRNT